VIAEEQRVRSARAASIDGAVAGTPLLFALVPGYLVYLIQEGHMLMRTAALYGHDPGELEASAVALTLRGVHPNVDAARSALLAVQKGPMPEKPSSRRRLRVWVRSIYELLIFGGFLSAPSDKRKEGSHPKLKTGLGAVIGATVWALTWIFPVSFMIAMAWGCGSNARQLGRAAIAFYDGDAKSAEAAIAAAKDQRDPGHKRRQILAGALLALSIAIPIGFVAYVDQVRQSTGVTALSAAGVLVALVLILIVAVRATR
jgi:hypothetical protein